MTVEEARELIRYTVRGRCIGSDEPTEFSCGHRGGGVEFTILLFNRKGSAKRVSAVPYMYMLYSTYVCMYVCMYY